MATLSHCTHELEGSNKTPDIYQLSVGSSVNTSWNSYYDKVCVFFSVHQLIIEIAFSVSALLVGFLTCNENVRGRKLTASRLHGLAVKKVLYIIRNYLILTCQTIVPLCLLWIGLAKSSYNTSGIEKLSLTSKTLEGLTVTYTVAEDGANAAVKMAEVYKESVVSSGGKPLNMSYSKMSGKVSSRNIMLTRNDADENDIFIGAIFETQNLSRLVNIAALYNLQAYHSEPISVAIIMRAIHRYCTLSTSNRSMQGHNLAGKRNVDIAVHPMPITAQSDARRLAMMCQKFCIHSSIFVVMALMFLTSMFTVILVKERMAGSKHLQYLSGINPLTFYISNFLCDIIVYIVECVIIFSSLAYFSNLSSMFQGDEITFICAILSYGMVSLPLIYSAQTLFHNPAVCVIVLVTIRIAAATCLLLLSSESRLLFDVDFPFFARNSIMLSLSKVTPSYGLLSTLYTMCIDSKSRAAFLSLEIICDNNQTVSDCKEAPGKEVISAPIIQFVCWSVIFLLQESKVAHILRIRIQRVIAALRMQRLKEITKLENADVEAERRRIENNMFADLITLEHIVKCHGRKIIIDNITAAISQGDCFCVLGRENTGKSTLMRILTGHTYPTSGTVLFGVQEKCFAVASPRVGMSFSPQKDALMDTFTGRETLIFYGRMRGVPEVLLTSIVQALLSILRISNQDMLCAYYSADERKKISVAAAIIGEPNIVVLDEPTNGMDYMDKKTVWQLLLQIHKLQRTIIVATSNAEECAVLSDRMAILSGGKLTCLASPSEIIQKYGTGYTVIAKFQTDENGYVYSQMPFLNFAVELFTNIEIISDNDVSRLQFADESLNLGKVFAMMEDGVRYFHVQDYSVQKTSLKHIMYTLSVCPEEEYIELPPGASPSFDRWPPKVSSLQTFGTSLN